MVKILVSPEELDKVSNLFKSSATQSEQMAAKLKQTVNNMDSQWDGMTSQKFFQEFQASQQKMVQYTQMLQQISEELKAIATRFREADNAR